MVDLHLIVENPYTLLTTIKEGNEWFTVLNLKDAFFYIPLEAASQPLFAFKWECPSTGHKAQLLC